MNPTLHQIARLFLKLGLIGFGGPAVHIAMMEEEIVRKKGWMTQQHFLDLVGATNLIPGPNSTEMAMHCGQERGGWKGLIVAGCCFIVPAVVITAGFAWAYQQYGQLPGAERFIYGIKPAIISILVSAMLALAKRAVKNATLALIGVAAVVAVLAGVNEIIVFFSAGIVGILLHAAKQKKTAVGIYPLPLLQAGYLAAGVAPDRLFWLFLKIGSILYGSGYVLFAFLDAELVAKGLLTKQQLIDAVAVGQVTPGPVFSAATFIGWQMGGLGGALAATVGIFLPSFLFVGFLNPLIPKLRQSEVMASFLDTVNVAAVAVILAVVVEMSHATLQDWRTILIAVASFVVTFYFKQLNTAFVVLGGAVTGYLLTLLP